MQRRLRILVGQEPLPPPPKKIREVMLKVGTGLGGWSQCPTGICQYWKWEPLEGGFVGSWKVWAQPESYYQYQRSLIERRARLWIGTEDPIIIQRRVLEEARQVDVDVIFWFLNHQQETGYDAQFIWGRECTNET